MTSLIDPGHRYEDIPASQAKQILMDFASFDRHSFNVKLSDTPYAKMGTLTDNGAVDTYDYYMEFFIRNNILIGQGGGFQLTDQGLALVSSEFRDPVSRERADQEILALVRRAEWIMDDPDHMVYMRAIIIFGSYVDTDKSLLGDLDVGICFGVKDDYKHLNDEQWASLARGIRARASSGSEADDISDYRAWAEDHMLSYLKGDQEFISMHRTREVETLRVQKIRWIYDAKKPLANHAIVVRDKLPMINPYLENTL